MYRRAKCAFLSLLLQIFAISNTAARTNIYKKMLVEKEVENKLRLVAPENLLNNHNEKVVSVFKEDETTVNGTCSQDLTYFLEALSKPEEWALQMLDASSKIPSGILKGNIRDFGMYDECIAVHEKTSEFEILGHHCTYSINLGQSIMDTTFSIATPSLSICLPSTCTSDDIMKLFNNTINKIGKQVSNISITSVTCSPTDVDIWDTRFTICFWILVAFVSFLVICSICDAISLLDTNYQKNTALRALGQFSLQKNASVILSTKVKKGNLPVIQGIRFLSMAWIVLGHDYLNRAMGATVNVLDFYDWVLSWKSLYIFVAQFSVDTFFMLSGFLMTYMFLKQMTKEKNFNIFMHYLHRFWRLTPPVIALTIISMVFAPNVGSGANWDNSFKFMVKSCGTKWWSNLLYLQNFISKDRQCLGHLWYLAVDMQLFWISPIILYPLYKKPKLGLIILTSLILASIVTPAVIITVNKYKPFSFIHADNLDQVKHALTDVYMMPYNRAGPWLIGILLGYAVVKDRGINKLTAWVGWILAFGCFIFCTFGIRYFMAKNYKYDAVVEALFTAFSRPLWAVGVSWIIYASMHNCAGPIFWFLSFKIYQPLSRLSYCVYLVHMVVVLMQVARQRAPYFFSDYDIWNTFFIDLILSFLVAFVFSLLFESPILIFEKMLLRRKLVSHHESRTKLTPSSE